MCGVELNSEVDNDEVSPEGAVKKIAAKCWQENEE